MPRVLEHKVFVTGYPQVFLSAQTGERKWVTFQHLNNKRQASAFAGKCIFVHIDPELLCISLSAQP